MNTHKPEIHPRIERRRHYVDSIIQGRLVAALVVLEVLLFTGAMLIVYQELNGIIEDQLYRVHVVDRSGVSVLLESLLWVVAGITAINAIALLVADRIWSFHVNTIVQALMRLLSSIGSLDFRDAGVIKEHHEVLSKAQQWQQLEKDRCRKIHETADVLNPGMDINDQDAVNHVRAVLERFRKLLP